MGAPVGQPTPVRAPPLALSNNVLLLIEDRLTPADSGVVAATTQKRSSGRFCVGQIIGQNSSGELRVQLYKPVQSMLEGAPPAANENERLARLLAVATSSCYIHIPSSHVVSSCQVSECPLTVRAALAVGKQPVLFKVGTCTTDGGIQWTAGCSGYLSTSTSSSSGSTASTPTSSQYSSSSVLAA
jgi:hypothetical protein